MPPCITRLLRSLRRPSSGHHASKRPTPLDSVRTALLQAVDDCTGLPAEQLQTKIRSARTRRDLWLLRSDAYHLIALNHCQSIADQRIHRLLHLFEDRVTPQDLGRLP